MKHVKRRWPPERIKWLRKKYHETQEEFARRLGITKFGLRLWEQDQYPPSEMAELLLDRLEIEIRPVRRS